MNTSRVSMALLISELACRKLMSINMEWSKQHSVCTKFSAYWSNASNYLKLGNKQTHRQDR
jgi:hypothetical protein